MNSDVEMLELLLCPPGTEFNFISMPYYRIFHIFVLKMVEIRWLFLITQLGCKLKIDLSQPFFIEITILSSFSAKCNGILFKRQ